MRVSFYGAMPMQLPAVQRKAVPQFGITWGTTRNPSSLGSPVLDAIARNDFQTFKRELSPDTVNVKSAAGRNTPLHVAIIYARPKMVREILQQKGVDLEITNAYGETPLETAQRQVAPKRPNLVPNSPEKQAAYQEILEMVSSHAPEKPPVSERRPQPAPPPSEGSGRTKQPAPPPADAEKPCSPKSPVQEIISGFLRLLGLR